jgi:hypothetical protein
MAAVAGIGSCTDPWEITSLTNHFMGANSGLPGGSWPAGTEFDTTMNFTLKHGSFVTECDASWPEKQHPTDWTQCKDETVSWRFCDSEWQECNFSLEIAVVELVQGDER